MKQPERVNPATAVGGFLAATAESEGTHQGAKVSMTATGKSFGFSAQGNQVPAILFLVATIADIAARALSPHYTMNMALPFMLVAGAILALFFGREQIE